MKPLGIGYEPGKGNSPADSVLHRVLPNAVVAKSDELFALAANPRCGRSLSVSLAALSR